MDTDGAAPSLLLALGLGFAALTAIALLAANPALLRGDDAPPGVEGDPCASATPPAPTPPDAGPDARCRPAPAVAAFEAPSSIAQGCGLRLMGGGFVGPPPPAALRLRLASLRP